MSLEAARYLAGFSHLRCIGVDFISVLRESIEVMGAVETLFGDVSGDVDVYKLASELARAIPLAENTACGAPKYAIFLEVYQGMLKSYDMLAALEQYGVG